MDGDVEDILGVVGRWASFPVWVRLTHSKNIPTSNHHEPQTFSFSLVFCTGFTFVTPRPCSKTRSPCNLRDTGTGWLLLPIYMPAGCRPLSSVKPHSYTIRLLQSVQNDMKSWFTSWPIQGRQRSAWPRTERRQGKANGRYVGWGEHCSSWIPNVV